MNLEEDLKMKKLPEHSYATFKNNEALITNLEDGREVQFRLLLTEDSKSIARLQESRDLPHQYAALAHRLIAVEGVDTDFPALVNFVENLDDNEADFLEQEMEKHDCGVDTDITITCKKCLYNQVVPLPFTANFFRSERKA